MLCAEKKVQIQALDRTQPLRPGLPERRTDGYSRQRAVEFRAFLKGIHTAAPPILEVQLVLDNYETHKTALIHDCFSTHPHYDLLFTPTSAPWINPVECRFADLTERQIRLAARRSQRPRLKRILPFTTSIRGHSFGQSRLTRSSSHSRTTVDGFVRPGTRARPDRFDFGTRRPPK